MRKKLCFFAIVSLLLAACGANETTETELQELVTEKVESETENEAEIENETETEIETETEAETEVETEAETESEPETVKQAEYETEAETEAVKNTQTELDQYGGYLEYTHSYGGDYCIGQYKFSVDDFGLLRDADKQFYKALADAGVGNIAYLGTNAHGGRTYAVMYYAPYGSDYEMSEAYGQMIGEYAHSQNLEIWLGAPHEDQALGWGGILNARDANNYLYYTSRQNFYTREEIYALREVYYPNNADEYHCPCGSCPGVWHNDAILSALTYEPDMVNDPWFWHY